MRITWNDLTVSSEGVDFDDLLSSWRWLVGEEYRPVVISSLGDLFLRRDDGRVFWLDTGAALLTEVASSIEDFKRLMVEPANAEQWFLPQLIGDLKASGIDLGPQQCYSYKVPPALGGEIELSNFAASDLSVHFSILGQVHEQVKSLPPGTPISEVRIKGFGA